MSNDELNKLYFDLLDLNACKYDLLKEIAVAECYGKSGKEVDDLIDSYATVYWYLNKKIEENDLIVRNKLCSAMLKTYPGFFEYNNIMDTIQNLDQTLPLKRMICDLGGRLFSFFIYDKLVEEKELHSGFSKYIKKFKDPIDAKLGCDVINSYMSYDYNSMLLSIVVSDIERTEDPVAKGILIGFKYNLIYISKDLENLAIKNRFNFSKDASLLDEKTISKAGISKMDYLDNINDIFGRLLESAVYDAINNVNDDQESSTIQYPDHLTIKAMANLITDKRICDDMILEPTNKMEDKIREATIVINADMSESKKVDTFNRKKSVI